MLFTTLSQILNEPHKHILILSFLILHKVIKSLINYMRNNDLNNDLIVFVNQIVSADDKQSGFFVETPTKVFLA